MAGKDLNQSEVKAEEHPSISLRMSGNTCFKCDRPGHYARDCQNVGGGGGRPGGPRDRQFGGGGGRREKCYKCNQMGHFARDCKEDLDRCYRCNGKFPLLCAGSSHARHFRTRVFLRLLAQTLAITLVYRSELPHHLLRNIIPGFLLPGSFLRRIAIITFNQYSPHHQCRLRLDVAGIFV